MQEGMVLARFRHTFPDAERWDRQLAQSGSSGPWGPCSKMYCRPHASRNAKCTIYFRDDEHGNVARIYGMASYFPRALREYLADHVPKDERGDYCIEAEHVDRVIELLRGE